MTYRDLHKKNKYGAERIELDGFKFASKAEMRRYAELRLLEKGRQVFDLRLQVPFQIAINGIAVCQYIADFVYKEKCDGPDIVEDVKSVATRTDVYVLKAKLMKAVHGITIREVIR